MMIMFKGVVAQDEAPENNTRFLVDSLFLLLPSCAQLNECDENLGEKMRVSSRDPLVPSPSQIEAFCSDCVDTRARRIPPYGQTKGIRPD